MIKFFRKLYTLKDKLKFSPFSVYESLPKIHKKEVSDLFIFKLNDYETQFVAENSLALLISDNALCCHHLIFFDTKGQLICDYKVFTESFHEKINLNKIPELKGHSQGSFAHFTKYSKKVKERYSTYLKNISFQHRGYTGFRKSNFPGFSYVHGNFGGLYVNKKLKVSSISRTRGKFIYTPQIKFQHNHIYELYFLNPNKKPIQIKLYKIVLKNHENFATLNLGPMCLSSYSLGIDNQHSDYNICWETNMPVGRSIVFEEHNDSFNVLHS